MSDSCFTEWTLTIIERLQVVDCCYCDFEVFLCGVPHMSFDAAHSFALFHLLPVQKIDLTALRVHSLMIPIVFSEHGAHDATQEFFEIIHRLLC